MLLVAKQHFPGFSFKFTSLNLANTASRMKVVLPILAMDIEIVHKHFQEFASQFLEGQGHCSGKSTGGIFLDQRA
jgi:hypothetical protein